VGRENKIRFRGAVERWEDARLLLQKSGDLVLVERGRPRLLMIACPCGCGERLVIHVDPRVQPSWRLYQRRRKITLFPSIWRESGCGSHFFIWGDRVVWCDYESSWWENYVDADLELRVLKILRGRDLVQYAEIAESIGEIPWSVLATCRRLAKRNKLWEGEGELKGHFRVI